MTITMKWKDIVANAKTIKKGVEKNGKLPKITGYSFPKLLGIYCNSIFNVGKNITITHNISNADNPTGTKIYKNLTMAQYRDVASRTAKWITNHKKLPNYTSFGKDKIKPQLLLFALCKIIVFYDSNKTMPRTCWFAQNVFGSPAKTGGALCSKLSKITGVTVKDYSSLYKAMSKFDYDYYYDDKQSQSKTLSRKKGNCVDLNQVEYYGLKELYSDSIVQIVRGTVKCSDGVTYGHVWCRLKINGKWINLDASAAAKGKSLGSLICNYVSITNINPSWAVNDTGGM